MQVKGYNNVRHHKVVHLEYDYRIVPVYEMIRMIGRRQDCFEVNWALMEGALSQLSAHWTLAAAITLSLHWRCHRGHELPLPIGCRGQQGRTRVWVLSQPKFGETSPVINELKQISEESNNTKLGSEENDNINCVTIYLLNDTECSIVRYMSFREVARYN